MRKLYILLAAGILIIGCARVRVEAPKDPIKLDISMRLDIYQHVVKDIDEIENIVSGQKGSMLLDIFVKEAYAETLLAPEVEQAAYSRRDRKSQLDSLEASGTVVENQLGLVEIKGSEDPSVKALVDAENADRMVIYKAIAAKNGVSLEEVQEIYAKKIQENMAR
ncbi:MAG: DUF1318 domain-containing protein [Candidatus Omnitrophota bacterium]|nr:DUF1318 domain-containing protein [Candidatus Omnitrophota bacterium]